MYLGIGNTDRFIIVDDGSTDNSTAFIPADYPRITLIRHPKNLGKTEAIKTALSAVTTSHILLMDADLKHLKSEEINRGVTQILKNPTIDMLIFIRQASGNVASVYSGERVLKTNILREALRRYPGAKHFQIEAAVNQYCLDMQKYVVLQPISASNTFQIEKKRSLTGFGDNIAMIRQIVALVGWKNYMKQLTGFRS